MSCSAMFCLRFSKNQIIHDCPAAGLDPIEGSKDGFSALGFGKCLWMPPCLKQFHPLMIMQHTPEICSQKQVEHEF